MVLTMRKGGRRPARILPLLVGSRRPASFTEADIKRALRAIRAVGEIPGRLVVGKDGGFTIELAPSPSPSAPPPVNDWDAE
jgi:hypothetical protein